MDGDGVDDSSNLNLTSSMGSVLTNNKNKESVSTCSGSSSSDSTSNKVASNISKKNIKSDVDNEADLFANECNISDVSVEKITENVDDIVSDLESLLGGPTDFSTLGKSEIKPAKIDLIEERTPFYFGSSNSVNLKNVSKIEQKDIEKSANVQEKKDTDDIVKPETNTNEVPSISLPCNEVPEAENLIEDNNMPGISAPEVKTVVEEIHIVETKNNKSIQIANNFNKEEICIKNDLEEKCSSSEYKNIEENIESIKTKDYNCDALLPIENTQNVAIVESKSVLISDKAEISSIQADHSNQFLIENNESETVKNTIIEKNESESDAAENTIIENNEAVENTIIENNESEAAENTIIENNEAADNTIIQNNESEAAENTIIEKNESKAAENTIIENNENLASDLIIITTTSTDNSNEKIDIVENTELPDLTESIEQATVKEANFKEVESVNQNTDEKCAFSKIETSIIQDDILISKIAESSHEDQITLLKECTNSDSDQLNMDKKEISTAKNVSDNCDESMIRNNCMQGVEINYDETDKKCNKILHISETMENDTSSSENACEVIQTADLLLHEKNITDLSSALEEDEEEKYELHQKYNQAADKSVNLSESEMIPSNELKVNELENNEIYNSVINTEPEQSTSMLYEVSSNINITDCKDAEIFENSQGYKNDNLESKNTSMSDAISESRVADILSDCNVQMDAEMLEEDKKVNENIENNSSTFEIESFPNINCENKEEPLKSSNIQEEINHFVEDGKNKSFDDNDAVQLDKATTSSNEKCEIENILPQKDDINMEIENDVQICLLEKSAECSNILTPVMNKLSDDSTHTTDACINVEKITDLSQLKEIAAGEIPNTEVIPSEVLSENQIIGETKAESYSKSEKILSSEHENVGEICTKGEIIDAQFVTKPECAEINLKKVGMELLLNDSVNRLMESQSEHVILDKTEISENIDIEKDSESVHPIAKNSEIATVNSGMEITEPELPKTNLHNVDVTLENVNSNEACEVNEDVECNKNLLEDSCEDNNEPISENILNSVSSITEHNNVFDGYLEGNEATQMKYRNKLEGGESDIIPDKQHDDSGNKYSTAETKTLPECKTVSLSSENGDLEETEQTMNFSKESDHDNSTDGEFSKSPIAPEKETLTLDTQQISSNTKSVNPCDGEYQNRKICPQNFVFKVEEKSELFGNSRSDNITSTSELINSCIDVNISEISEKKNETESSIKVNEIKEVEIVQKGNSANKVVCIKESEEFEQYINVTSENEKLHSAIDDQAEEKVFEFSSDKEEMNSDVDESDNILHGQSSMYLIEPETKQINLDKIDEVPTKSENNDNEEYIKESNYSQDDELLKAALEASYEEDKPNSKEDRTIIENVKSSSILEEIDERNKHEENVLIQAAADAENNRLNHNYEKPLNIVVDPPIDEIINTVKEVECSNKTETEIYNKQGGEYSSKISQNLKLTITKNKSDEKSILKIFDPKESDNSVVEISPSESDSEETPIPKFLIKQPQKLMSPLKITIKPVIKPEEQTQKSSPKLIIKPIIKPDEEAIREEKLHHSPKITIKPIPKPNSEEGDRCNSPKITIKPIIKPIETSMSPKIKIKPIIKPVDDAKEEVEERIVLKITKNNITHTEVKKEENEKLAKIKLKFSKDNRHAHIVNEKDKSDEKCVKRVIQDTSNEMSEDNVCSSKRLKFDVTNEGCATVSHIEAEHDEHKGDISDNTTGVLGADAENQDSNSSPIPTPRKRGRPRKNPLVVREEFKDIKEEVVQVEEIHESPSGRPKRSCRGPSVRTTLGIKPRKARGATRSRGRGRGVSTRGQIKNDNEAQKEISDSKIKLLKEAAISARVTESLDNQDVEMKEIIEIPTETIIIEDSNEEKLEIDNKSIITKSADVMIFEDETRMSAEINSRAQTPAKQVSMDVIEESQSSIQSTATTESTKIRKGTKMEIALEPEGAIISADQLAEYYWGGGGPYMLQEQVAQFLGIKSFKRKYPGIQRRTVDMQERDFIRESSLASEHMCDLGLTAVNSVDILDIMYSDFQNKYEEYCKHQRDRQTKDITNKQKALSLAASQEKNKLDIMQQAVESAAQWNYNFNKSRKEERIACMDLQTYTINYPKGRFKQINKPKLGYYPMALVPGQYTDFYKTFTPTELNNLPLSTMLYHDINTNNEEDSQSDNSVSDSDSSSSESDSSDSDSSDETDCNLCTPSNAKKVIT